MRGSWGCWAPSPRVHTASYDRGRERQPHLGTNPGLKILNNEPVMVFDFMRAIGRTAAPTLWCCTAHQSEEIWLLSNEKEEGPSTLDVLVITWTLREERVWPVSTGYPSCVDTCQALFSLTTCLVCAGQAGNLWNVECNTRSKRTKIVD